MNPKDEAISKFHRNMIMLMDSRYEAGRPHLKKVFESETFERYGNTAHFEKVNNFVTELMIKISNEVYQTHRGDVHLMLYDGIKQLVNDLFTDEECKQFVDFMQSDAGLKLFRNLDLIRDSMAEANNYLVVKTIKAWNNQDIINIIDSYIESLENTEFGDEQIQ